MKKEKTTIPYRNRVFIALGCFFGVIIAANAVLIYLAIASEDGLVEDNYYYKGLNYQQEINQQKRQKVLGWKVSLNTAGTDKFEVKAFDKDGTPLENAQVDLLFFRPTNAGHDQVLKLHYQQSGIYTGTIELPFEGIWDVYINIRQDGTKWKTKQRIQVKK